MMKKVALIVLASISGLCGLFWLARHDETAHEVITGTVGLIFSFFSSPFILEASLAFLALILVLSYNHRKLEREGKDEWVMLPAEEVLKQTAKSTPKKD